MEHSILGSYCLVPVFLPALPNLEYVIHFVTKIKNRKAVKIEEFQQMYNVMANPALLTDEEMWKVILEVIHNFNGSADSIILNRGENDMTIKKLTGFMLNHYKSAICKKMLKSSGLEFVPYVASSTSMILVKILSLVWVPVLLGLEQQAQRLQPVKAVSIPIFHTIKNSQITLPDTCLEVLSIKTEWKAFAMNECQDVMQTTIFWEDQKDFIYDVAKFAFEFFGLDLVVSKIPSDLDAFVNGLKKPIQCDKTNVSGEVSLQSLHESIKEINCSEESLFPNETDESQQFSDDESGDDSDDNDEHSDESHYRLYHPTLSNSDVERYFKTLKKSNNTN